MQVNDIVKYSKPANGEESFRFVLLHVEKGKADIQLICDSTIKPVETVAIEEIEAVPFDSFIADLQDVQKRNPFNSGPHRAAFKLIRETVLAVKGIDIGVYE